MYLPLFGGGGGGGGGHCILGLTERGVQLFLYRIQWPGVNQS